MTASHPETTINVNLTELLAVLAGGIASYIFTQSFAFTLIIGALTGGFAFLLKLSSAQRGMNERISRNDTLIAEANNLADRAKSIASVVESKITHMEKRLVNVDKEIARTASLLVNADKVLRIQSDSMSSVKNRTTKIEETLVEFDGFLADQANSIASEVESKITHMEKRLVNVDKEIARTAGLLVNADKALRIQGDSMSSVKNRTTKIEETLIEFDGFTADADRQYSEITSQLESLNQRFFSVEQNADILRVALREKYRTGVMPGYFYTANSFDPETDLLPILKVHCKSKLAVDVGANRGDFTAAMRRAGFSVDAFEPHPDLVRVLTMRFKTDDKVRIHGVALDAKNGTGQMHVAVFDDPITDSTLFSSLTKHPSYPGMRFDHVVDVPVRTLDTVLAGNGVLDVGLLKIDSEGYDIQVLRGARKIRPENLMVEFWDKDFVFNREQTNNTIDQYASEVDQNAFPFNIVMWRGGKANEFGFITKLKGSPEGSWGNIVFFSDEVVYESVLTWVRETFGSDRLTTG